MKTLEEIAIETLKEAGWDDWRDMLTDLRVDDKTDVIKLIAKRYAEQAIERSYEIAKDPNYEEIMPHAILNAKTELR